MVRSFHLDTVFIYSIILYVKINGNHYHLITVVTHAALTSERPRAEFGTTPGLPDRPSPYYFRFSDIFLNAPVYDKFKGRVWYRGNRSLGERTAIELSGSSGIQGVIDVND